MLEGAKVQSQSSFKVIDALSTEGTTWGSVSGAFCRSSSWVFCGVARQTPPKFSLSNLQRVLLKGSHQKCILYRELFMGSSRDSGLPISMSFLPHLASRYVP